MIIYSHGGTKAQEDEANSILEVLSFAYPGHPWGVRVYDGGFFIRHLHPDLPAGWGMNCKFKNISHDAAVMKREIIFMAGEFLERTGMARGRYDGDQEIVRLEGVPEREQPHQKLPEDVGLLMPDGSAIREEPMPQVLK